MSHIPFISDPAEITPAWLTQALGENGHLTDGRVTDVSFDERMKADRQINRVFVTYSDEARGTRPASIRPAHRWCRGAQPTPYHCALPPGDRR